MVNLIRKQVNTLSQEQTNIVLDHLEQTLNLRIDRIYSLSDQLIVNERLRVFLSAAEDPQVNEADLEIFLTNRFRELVIIYDEVISMFAFEHREDEKGEMRILSNRGQFDLNDDNPIEKQEWYVRARDNSGEVVITPPHLQNFIKRNYIWVVSFSRQVKDLTNDIVIGVLLIEINIDIIKDICIKNSTKTHYYYLIDEIGDIVFHPQEQLIYSGLFEEPIADVLNGKNGTFRIKENGFDRIYTIRTQSPSGWKIVGVTNVKQLYAPFNPSVTFLLIWVGLSLLFLLLISRLIALRVLNPINLLRLSMKKVEEGRFDISVRVSDYDEVGALARDFNIMIRKISELIEMNEEEQRKLRISDFRALQSQINPHFLYNTLDSVIWMSAKGNTEDVIAMVSSLSKLMRRSLATGESLVTLEEEYEHAKQYCIIQKIRYRDQLDYHMELPEECRNIKVPRLILQPLIENVLYHGIEDWDDGGEIRIVSENILDRLEITISDNGKGAEPMFLQEILEGEEQIHSLGSIGLKNINDRLKILFGNEAGIQFRSQSHEGLDVILSIPLNPIDKLLTLR